MFRLLTGLPQTAMTNSRRGLAIHSNPSILPITERCIPKRRRRARKKATLTTNENLRSSWF
jgi:hypothetical protein